MNTIDKAIAYVLPGWAARRVGARLRLGAMRAAYDAADPGGRTRGRRTPPSVGPVDEARSRAAVVAASRDLDRNNSWSHGVFNSIANNIVGSGITPESRVKARRGGGFATKLNDGIEEEWKRWQDSADLRGQLSYYEMQRLAEREQWVTGEVLLVRSAASSRRGGRLPLALELIESERLSDLEQEERNGNRIIQGVEFGKDSNRPIAYHIYSDNPFDGLVAPLRRGRIVPDRIPANRVIHLFQADRPNQIRGISPMSSVLETVQALGQYFNYELTKARIASAFVGAIETQSVGGFKFATTGDVADDTDADDNDLGYLEGGTIARLKPGEKMSFGSPSVTSTAFEPFVVTMLRSVAVGLNVSYELLARDFTKTNFSSARQSALEDRKHWEPRQNRIGQKLGAPVWRWFIESLVIENRVTGIGVLPSEAFAVWWKTPGWAWVDPVKEVAADKEAVRAGFDSPQNITAKRGKDLRTIIGEIAEAQAMAEKAGVTLDVLTDATVSEPPPPASGDEELRKVS